MKAIRLRTEYLNNPIGIDIQTPRLFWNCEGGTKQTGDIPLRSPFLPTARHVSVCPTTENLCRQQAG